MLQIVATTPQKHTTADPRTGKKCLHKKEEFGTPATLVNPTKYQVLTTSPMVPSAVAPTPAPTRQKNQKRRFVPGIFHGTDLICIPSGKAKDSGVY